MSEGKARSARGAALQVCLVALAVGMAWSAPPLRAMFDPPPGRVFGGSFLYQDDVFQYFSFAEQASRGAIVFTNKFDSRIEEPFFLNVGWWLVGVVGRLVSSLPLGMHVVSGAASACLALGVARLLRLHGASLFPGLLFVLFAGRLDWILRPTGLPTGPPYLLLPTDHLALHVSHSLLALALLVWTIVLLVEWTLETRRAWPWLVLATTLGLVRPFDLSVVLVVALAMAARDFARGGWVLLRRHLRLLWICPVVTYLSFALVLHPSFALWSGAQNVVSPPSLSTLAAALALPLTLGFVGVWRRRGEIGRPVLLSVLAWAGAGLAMLLVQTSFGMQAVTSLGLALLSLAGLVLPRRALWIALLVSIPSTVGLFAEQWKPLPQWYLPADYMAAANFMAKTGSPSDVVYGPSDPSLVVAAFSPCRVVFGHRVLTPEMDRRSGESVVFYDPRIPPAWRSRYLSDLGATFVLLPPGGGHLLGPAAAGTKYEMRLRLPSLEIWSIGRRDSSAPSMESGPILQERLASLRLSAVVP